MDAAALEYTRDHYNRHALQHKDAASALHARAAGPGLPLKRFHNAIKRRLIERFAGGAEALLDLACGRGGDILKWIDAGVGYAKGVDLSPAEVEEARKRFADTLTRRGAARATTRCEFVASAELGAAEFREPRQYDVVTCMFAAHYFFVAEPALRRLLANVALNLKDGGYFVGTVPDGKRVNECIRGGRVFASPMLRVEAHWRGAPAPFGSPYVCAIGDTVTAGDKGTAGSFEYLVYARVLEGVAAEVGLRPVLAFDDAELEAMLEPADARAGVLKHFAPRFPGSDPSLERASALFAAFAFQKVGPGEAARAPARRDPAAAPAVAAAAAKRPAAAAAAADAPAKPPVQLFKRPGGRRRAPPPAAAAAEAAAPAADAAPAAPAAELNAP